MTFVDPFAPYDSPHHPVNAGRQVPVEPTEDDLRYLVELWPFVLNTFGTEEEQGREFDPYLGEELIDRRPEYRDLLERFGTQEEQAETVLADDPADEDEFGDDAPTLRDLRARQAEHVDAQVKGDTLATDLDAISAEALTRPAASAPKPAWKAHLRALDPSVSDEDAEAMTVDVLKATTRELAARAQQ